MSEVIFAQVCRTVSAVDESKSLMVDLYKNKTGIAREITAEDFINLFYSRTESGDYKFNINLDASSNKLCKQYLDLSNNWWERYAGGEFQITERIPSAYANMMGITEDCFDTCSLMRLRSELLELENICGIWSKCKLVCCSLSLDELIEILKDGDNDASHRRNESSATINFGAVATADVNITISDVVFTAKTSGASEATQYNIGNDEEESATNLKEKLAAHSNFNSFDIQISDATITLKTKASFSSPASQNTKTITTNMADVTVTNFSGGVNPMKRKDPKDETIAVNRNSDGSTYVDRNDAEKFLMKNDQLGFSILITNPSNKVKDIELILHFRIKN
jgi:hypothetical protein